MNEQGIVLQGRGITKSFGGTEALSGVDFDVRMNQVVGIVGENGAGKTTLFNILSGIVPPDAGGMVCRGRPFAPAGYRDASQAGISRVFQEQALIPNIRVYENLLLSYEAAYSWAGQLIDKKRMIATAQRIIDEAGLDIDVRRPTASYNFSKRQLIEIARACIVPTEVLGIQDPIVLLDEPTSALEKTDEEVFRKLITRLRERASIVFVSHRLSEVLELSDVIYVLKDGRLVATVDPAIASERVLHERMVGREREADYYHESDQLAVDDRPVVYRVQGLTHGGHYDDVSFEVRSGEIVGIGGLLKSGKSEFGKGVAGIIPPDSGSVLLNDDDPEFPDVCRLTARGLAYVPAERLLEGLISRFSAAWNVSLAGGGDLFANRFGIWRGRREAEVTNSFIEKLAIKAGGPHVLCSTLSGGNQQKIVLARWLCREVKVLILDNPTRGVDAGAKEEIYKLIRKLSSEGVGIILITDELLELIGLSNRVVIMRHGRVAQTVDASVNAKPTERQLIEIMLSQSHSDGDAIELAVAS